MGSPAPPGASRALGVRTCDDEGGAAASSSRHDDDDDGGLSWYVKTEQFVQPFPVLKPHLEAHRAWVAAQRNDGVIMTSGYRVDSEGKPGGGGMLFFKAESFSAAEAIVLRDPLVANGCVDWTLNGWIAEVGEMEVR